MLLLPSSLHYAKLLNSCVNILMNFGATSYLRGSPESRHILICADNYPSGDRPTPQDSFFWFWIYALGSSGKRSPV